MAAEWRNLCAGDLPRPEGFARRSQPQIERPVGKNGAPEYPANTNCEAAKPIPPEAKIRRPLKVSCTAFPLEERVLGVTGTSSKHATFPPNSEGDDFLPHPLAISPSELDQLIEPAGGLEEGVGQVEREAGAVALLPDFEIVEEPANVGEEEGVADLGLLWSGGSIFANGFFRSQCL